MLTHPAFSLSRSSTALPPDFPGLESSSRHLNSCFDETVAIPARECHRSDRSHYLRVVGRSFVFAFPCPRLKISRPLGVSSNHPGGSHAMWCIGWSAGIFNRRLDFRPVPLFAYRQRGGGKQSGKGKSCVDVAWRTRFLLLARLEFWRPT
jgi:hypothetical protein